jgi:hypothetical protein
MTQQTAVQKLFEWIDANSHEESFNIFDAKEMALSLEKKQIAEAYEIGWINGDLKKAPRFGEDYYKETYGK